MIIPKKTNFKINQIAILCFIVFCAFFLAKKIPIFSIVVVIFLPSFTATQALKLAKHDSFLFFVISVLLTFIVFYPNVIDIYFFLSFLVLGFLMGELIRLNFAFANVVVISSYLLIFATLFFLLGLIFIFDVDINQLLLKNFLENLDNLQAEGALTLYEGVSKAELISYGKVFISIINQIGFALFSAFIFLISLFNLMLISSSLKDRIKKNFASWQVPYQLVWFIIGSGIVLFLSKGVLATVCLNFLIVLMLLYFLQGICIVEFFFEKKNFSKFWRVFFYTLVFLQQIFLLIVSAIGFFDIWINFRKIKEKPLNKR